MAPTAKTLFDINKLNAMVEPLHLRVERLRGAMSSPITIPPRNDGVSPGTGWSKEDIAGVEDWLKLEWSGGGHYRITVTDTQGTTLQWCPFWDPRQIPERPTPTDVAAGVPVPAAAAPAAPQIVPLPTPIRTTPVATALPSFVSEGRSSKDEEIRRLEREKLEIEYRARLEQQTARHNSEINELRRSAEAGRNMSESAEITRLREEQMRMERERMESQIRQLTEMVARQAQQPAVDPRIEQLQAELRAQREAAREERERFERREEQARIQQQMRDNEARMAAMVAELKQQQSNRPDALMLAMQEMQRTNAENMRELARMQQQQLAQMQSLMMPPQAVVQMVKDSSNGSDQFMKSVVGTFSGIFDTYKAAMEQVAQLNGGGGDSPVVRLIEAGLSKIDTMGEKYFEKEAIKAQADAQVEIAKARAAAARAETLQGAAVAPQPSPPAAAPATPKKLKSANGANGANGANANGAAKPVPTAKQTPDQEWFGAALPRVIQLREGVMTYLNNLQAKEPKLTKEGEPIGISAEGVVKAILQAAAYVQMNNIPVKAFRLLDEQRFPELLDLLLPPPVVQTFRDHCIQLLHAATAVGVNGGDDEDDEDEDEDEDSSDEGVVALVPRTSGGGEAEDEQF